MFDVAYRNACARAASHRPGRRLRPDLVIVDIRMPPTHTTEGLEAAEAIREEFPDTPSSLSAHVQVEGATVLLASGERSGYLLKSRLTDVEDFVETLERIVKGASVVDPALVQELIAARGDVVEDDAGIVDLRKDLRRVLRVLRGSPLRSPDNRQPATFRPHRVPGVASVCTL